MTLTYYKSVICMSFTFSEFSGILYTSGSVVSTYACFSVEDCRKT